MHIAQTIRLMDPNYQFPASPGTPLFQVSPERVNQQRLDINHSPSLSLTSGRHTRESSVQEKAAKFDTLAFQSKALERKTNDAALKRAMLGREEAESEMRRYRDEARNLRKQLEEAGMRERKVGERLENVMVSLFQIRRKIFITDGMTGKLRQNEGDARAHKGSMGEGDPSVQERIFQVPIRDCQATRRA